MSEKINVTLENYQDLAILTKKNMRHMVLPMDVLEDSSELIEGTRKHIGFCFDAMHMSSGIIGEVGELDKAIKNNDLVNLREEAGDICWFVAVACKDNDLSFKDIVIEAENSLDSENYYYGKGYDAYGYVDFIKKMVIYNDGVITDNYLYRSETYKYLANIMRMVINQTYWRADSGFDLMTILDINISKLNKRFGDRFSRHLANNRDLVAERTILEK